MKKSELPQSLRARQKSREAHLAAAFLRGVPYRVVEWTTRNPISGHAIAWTLVKHMHELQPFSDEYRAKVAEYKVKIEAWLYEPVRPEFQAYKEAELEAAKRDRTVRKAAHRAQVLARLSA